MKDLLNKIIKAKIVYICGNGGSSATAEHMTNDLFSKGIKAICLNSNTSIMTMIANDFGYQYTFSKQLNIFGTANDLLITISCSGTSPNIVEVERVAEKLLMPVYSFPTFTDGRDYEKLEDEHMRLVHQLKKLL